MQKVDARLTYRVEKWLVLYLGCNLRMAPLETIIECSGGKCGEGCMSGQCSLEYLIMSC